MMAKPCAGQKRRNPVSVPIVPTAQHGFKADNLAARRWREDANSWCRRNWVPATHEGQATRDDLLLSSSCPPPPTTDVRRFLATPDCRSTASASRRRVDGCPDLLRGGDCRGRQHRPFCRSDTTCSPVTAEVNNTDLSAGSGTACARRRLCREDNADLSAGQAPLALAGDAAAQTTPTSPSASQALRSCRRR